MQAASIFKALSNERRLRILEWLRNPARHFPPQTDGDIEEIGVCGLSLAEKLGISQATLSEHMRVLAQVGLVRATRSRQWVFYRRDESRIAQAKDLIERL
jgi:ArsR family transcriptional regulator